MRGSVLLRRNSFQADEAPAHIQMDADHAGSVHRWIERRYSACATGGEESLGKHFSRTLPVPEKDGGGPIFTQHMPASRCLVVRSNVVQVVVVRFKRVSLVRRRLGVSQLLDNLARSRG